MNYSNIFMLQHEDMCQEMGSIVFALAESGYEPHRDNIVAVFSNGPAEPRKWESDQVLYLQLAIDLLNARQT